MSCFKSLLLTFSVNHNILFLRYHNDIRAFTALFCVIPGQKIKRGQKSGVRCMNACFCACVYGRVFLCVDGCICAPLLERGEQFNYYQNILSSC